MKRVKAVMIMKAVIIMLTVSFMTNGISFAAKAHVSKQAVNVNQATAKELSSLPGIGKVKAEAIIAYREKNGKFLTVEDIKKVDGIGKETLEKIKDQIVLE